MKPNNIYLAELYLSKCKITLPLPQKIFLTFRIGKNMVQSTISRMSNNGEIDLDCTLQLNTDKLALDTQRSSLTISSIGVNNQISVIGIVLISLPQNSMELVRRCKLTQCVDKNAQAQLSLRIKSLDSPILPEVKPFSNAVQSSGNSSNRSNIEMQQIDKKTISSSQLLSPLSNSKVFPPKPKTMKELPNTSESLRESVSKLECECDCLKQLLKVQLQKGEQSNKLIDELVSVLEQVNQNPITISPNQLDQTLLLEGIDKQDSFDQIRLKNQQLQKEVIHLKSIIQKLSIQNKNLNESLQKTSETTRKNSRETLLCQNGKDIIIKANSQKYLGDGNKKVDKYISQFVQLENQLLQRMEESQRYKKKMKISTKIPIIQSIVLQKSTTPAQTIRMLMDRCINENKQMIKLILKYLKHQSDVQSEGLLKLKQKIDKTFTNLISKKMNRDILLFEKGELIKGIEQLWQKQKFI